MKSKKPKISLEVRNYFSALGKIGGKSGTQEDKRKAALARWGKTRTTKEA